MSTIDNHDLLNLLVDVLAVLDSLPRVDAALIHIKVKDADLAMESSVAGIAAETGGAGIAHPEGGLAVFFEVYGAVFVHVVAVGRRGMLACYRRFERERERKKKKKKKLHGETYCPQDTITTPSSTNAS